MHRRSAVSRMAATLAGLSLAEVPDAEGVESEPFSVTPANLPQSSGTVTCPVCREMADSLQLTPAGLCLACADRSPMVRARPHSDPFWTLPPRQVRRLEREIRRLSGELNRMNQKLADLGHRQIAEGGQGFDREVEAVRDQWHALQRELHLLHHLRAVSRQFRA